MSLASRVLRALMDLGFTKFLVRSIWLGGQVRIIYLLFKTLSDFRPTAKSILMMVGMCFLISMYMSVVENEDPMYASTLFYFRNNFVEGLVTRAYILQKVYNFKINIFLDIYGTSLFLTKQISNIHKNIAFS